MTTTRMAVAMGLWAGIALGAHAHDVTLEQQPQGWVLGQGGSQTALTEVSTVTSSTQVRHFHDGQEQPKVAAALTLYRSHDAQPWVVATRKNRVVGVWRGTGDERLVEAWQWTTAGRPGRWRMQAPAPQPDIDHWDCDSGLHDKAHPLITPAAPTTQAKAVTPPVQGVLAVDTDTEFMALKFSNNTTAATQYIQSLVAAINVIYERDLGLRLTLGEVILRTGTDPYTQTDSFQQLLEVGNWWSANRSGSPRSFVAMLSGKSPNPNSASGIAWLLGNGAYCQQTQGSGGHYSLNRVFRFAQNTVAQDLGLVAHEIGHNLGAAHTHCTDGQPGTPGLQPLDMCFNREPSDSFNTCYSGPEMCPAGGSGTLMSYCHLSTASCGPNQQAFHPFHIAQLDPRIEANRGVCFTTLNTSPDTIFRNGFEQP